MWSAIVTLFIDKHTVQTVSFYIYPFEKLIPLKMNAIRKKQPEVVRLALLKEALRILQFNGMQGLTLEAVAKQAGVSKGGLLHHFPSKQALIEGMVSHVFETIEAQIDKSLQSDTVAQGRFTRAYVDVLNMEDEDMEYLNSIP